MCEKIRDYMRKILTSQPVSEIEIKNSSTFYQTRAGRKCIANLIHQEKFKNHVLHQLSDKGFELMTQIICNYLIYAEFIDDQLEDIIKLVKACFHYYKLGEKGKEQIFLNKELNKNHLKIWENENLWSKWYDLEVKTEIKDGNLKMDVFLVSKLYDVFSYMRDLGLELQFIVSCIGKLASEFITEEEAKKDLIKVIKKQFNIHYQK